ncbi:jg7328 [Pararge aegeria aegeria]|uniref:Jg7328 protein n=1 Tax=Pararge aegeria aegeria TaxID=348720 RepID=A0A8S4RJP1_9NEOP|nr:jg7328 [Pararge aegeria aegeria]
MTPSLKPLDGLCLKGKHWRDHRSIHQNIIPAATGACKALGKIIPSVKDKLTGLAFRVPIVNVSVLDITVRLNKNTTMQDIIKCVEMESKLTMRSIIKISKDQEVSSDFLGDENSCILDVNSSLQLNQKFFKLICWYENEYSYACRVVGSIKYSEENRYKIPFDRIISSKPIPDFKTEHVISDCHAVKRQKILFSASKKTGILAKSLEQQINIKRPLPHISLGSNQAPLGEIKQCNEIFKVWNDEEPVSRHLLKENKKSLFQSCMTLGGTNASQSQKNNFAKTKERLDQVKKEFSKMVDMTENLLKKSSQEIIILNEGIENRKEKKDMKLEFDNTRPRLPPESKSISMNFHTNISKIYADVFKTYKTENSNTLMDTNTLNDITKLEFKDTNQKIDIKCNAKIPDKLLTLRHTGRQDRQDNEINTEKDKPTKNDELVQRNFRIENTISNLKKSLCTITGCNDNFEPNYFSHKTDLGSINPCKKLIKHDIQHDEERQLNNYSENDRVRINTKEDFEKPAMSDLSDRELKVTYINPESSQLETNKSTNKNEIRKKIIEGILKILTADSMEDKMPPSLVNTDTTISTREANKSLDIYDKIDSVSATDSENSFQINEKTSQVIDIKDLTSSTEDLDRLDKICRIIEISDEMSDKLFSVLDHNDINTKQKPWSFKDLCERLKLDEFCNSVFGPT